MKRLTLIDDHNLCIRTFLNEIDELGIISENKSVLHFRAHMGEEVPAYSDHGYSQIYLVGANPEVLPNLTLSFKHVKDIHITPLAVGDSIGETEFVVHRTRKGGMKLSGILNLARLGDIVPIFDSEVRHRAL